MLVTTGWLADHLHDPNLVIIGVGRDEEYKTAHIPGSVFLPYHESLMMNTNSPLTLELPPMGDLEKLFGGFGVTNASRVVLYWTKDWYAPTARVYLTLDAMGLGRNASILDGGFPAWQSESRLVSDTAASVKAGVLHACPQNDVVVDTKFVESVLHKHGTDIVDARLPEYYTGAKIPNGQRAGHIPGAVNIRFTSMVDDRGKLKSAEALRQIFVDNGVRPGDRVVAYCHIGQQASLIYFVSRYLGYDVRLYDGSWEDWSAHKDLPAELSTRSEQ